MTSLLSAPRTPTELARHPAVLTWSTAGGLTVGGLTQLGQSYLPDPLLSLANSAGPWVLAAFALAWLSPTAARAALSGLLTLAASEIGYVVMAALRGYPSATDTMTFWLAAAAVFGPVVGLAAYAVHQRRSPVDALGGGLVAGLLSGEGLVAWLTVRDTTTPGYWIGEMAVGALMLVLVARRTSIGWAVVGFNVGVMALLATRLAAILGT